MLKKILLGLLLWAVYANSFALSKILILGDSLSAAYGFDVQQSWVSLLQKKLKTQAPGVEIINASISGSTTAEGVAQLPVLLARVQPDLLLLELGANDALRGIPPQATRANLTQMIQMAQQKSIKIILIGLRVPPNLGLRYAKEFIQIYADAAQQYNLPLVPQMLAGVDDKPALLQADGLHPTALAQPIIFANVWQVLKEVLHKELR